MKKKITHSVLFVAVLAGTTALTLFAGGDRSPVSDRNVWRNVPYE